MSAQKSATQNQEPETKVFIYVRLTILCYTAVILFLSEAKDLRDLSFEWVSLFREAL